MQTCRRMGVVALYLAVGTFAWGAAETASAPATTSCPAQGVAEVIHSSRTPEEVKAAAAAQEEKLKSLKFQAPKFDCDGGGGYRLSYRLSSPKPQSPGRKYPLVIFYGGNLTGANPFAAEEYQAKYPCFVAEMQAAVPPQDVGPGKSWKQNVARMIEAVVAQLVRTHAIDPSRVYATGHSAGGGVVWATAIACPNLLAAIAPSAATCDVSQAPVLVEHKIAVWIFMGAKDAAVGIDNPRGARAMVQAIVNAGGRVKYTEYDNLGHAYACVTEPDFSALLEWMFAQRRSVGRPAAVSDRAAFQRAKGAQ